MASSTTDVTDVTDSADAPEKVTVVKASFNLPERELNALRRIAARRSLTVTHALRQAIAIYAFLAEQPGGTRLLVEDPGGKRREVLFQNLA